MSSYCQIPVRERMMNKWGNRDKGLSSLLETWLQWVLLAPRPVFILLSYLSCTWECEVKVVELTLCSKLKRWDLLWHLNWCWDYRYFRHVAGFPSPCVTDRGHSAAVKLLCFVIFCIFLKKVNACGMLLCLQVVQKGFAWVMLAKD